MSLRVDNLSFKYDKGEKEILNNINFSLESGESLAIIGPIGCGKSTLISCLNKFNSVDDNTIFIIDDDDKDLDKDINDLKNEVFYSLTGTIFTDPESQYIKDIVEDEIIFSLENRAVEIDIIKEKVDKILKKLKLDDLRKRRFQSLSGGEKQLAILASVLVYEPKILFLDDATIMLDKKNKKIFLDNLFNSKRTIILTSNDLAEIAYCDKLLLLDENGKMVCFGDRSEMYEKYSEKIIELGLDVLT